MHLRLKSSILLPLLGDGAGAIVVVAAMLLLVMLPLLVVIIPVKVVYL